VVYVPVAFFRWPDGLVAIPVTLTYVVIFVACSLVVLAFWLTIIAAAPGECSGWEALVLGWRRVFSRGLVRRTVLVASLALAIEFASSTVFALIGSWLAVATATRSWSSILTWSGAAAQAGLLCAFFVLYSLDVRIRREGFDLAVAAGLDRS
jgi:hypothetical protein